MHLSIEKLEYVNWSRYDSCEANWPRVINKSPPHSRSVVVVFDDRSRMTGEAPHATRDYSDCSSNYEDAVETQVGSAQDMNNLTQDLATTTLDNDIDSTNASSRAPISIISMHDVEGLKDDPRKHKQSIVMNTDKALDTYCKKLLADSNDVWAMEQEQLKAWLQDVTKDFERASFQPSCVASVQFDERDPDDPVLIVYVTLDYTSDQVNAEHVVITYTYGPHNIKNASNSIRCKHITDTHMLDREDYPEFPISTNLTKEKLATVYELELDVIGRKFNRAYMGLRWLMIPELYGPWKQEICAIDKIVEQDFVLRILFIDDPIISAKAKLDQWSKNVQKVHLAMQDPSFPPKFFCITTPRKEDRHKPVNLRPAELSFNKAQFPLELIDASTLSPDTCEALSPIFYAHQLIIAPDWKEGSQQQCEAKSNIKQALGVEKSFCELTFEGHEHGVNGPNATRTNTLSASICWAIVELVLQQSGGAYTARDIVIITPYRGQVEHHQRMRASIAAGDKIAEVAHIDVATLGAKPKGLYDRRGRPRKIVIFDLTATKSLEFVAEGARYVMAPSRAEHLFIQVRAESVRRSARKHKQFKAVLKHLSNTNSSQPLPDAIKARVASFSECAA